VKDIDGLQGWLVSPAGPVHRRAGDRATCRATLHGALACTVLAARAHKVPVCPLCFPAGTGGGEAGRALIQTHIDAGGQT
jgi:hypothetical protein